LFDLSGGGNNGTLTNGASVITNRAGRALDFDGTNDYAPLTTVNLNQLVSPTFNAAVSLWVYPRSQSRNVYIADWNSVGLSETFRFEMSGFQMTSNRIGGNIQMNGALSPVQTQTDVALNQWHHFVIQCSVSTQFLHWNGRLEHSAVIGIAPTPASNPIVLGRAGSFDALYANAQLDDIRIYNRALSESEILNNFNATRGRYGI